MSENQVDEEDYTDGQEDDVKEEVAMVICTNTIMNPWAVAER